MTRDDILRMAREAGFVLSSNATGEAMGRFARFAALVAAEEREACAKVCEEKSDRWASVDDDTACALQACAAAIRARRTQ